MIVGVGIDVIQNDRIRDSIARFGPRFLNRIYTQTEIDYCANCGDPAIHYAARFAAKEAGMKAIGTGWKRGVRWKDLEVANLPSGRPTLRLHGEAAKIAERLGVKSILLSITHTAQFGMAQVILEN